MIITHFHLFCGAGGGALGFNQGTARVGSLTARFQCLGGVDHDPAAIRDFGRLVGVPGTVLDLFDREQYTAFHGRAPAGDWREATPQDLHAAAQHQRPDIVFLSAPCLPGCSEVLTPQGPRRIETLRAGDLVLTHKGRYREVLKVGTHHYTGDMFGFRLNGTVDVQAFTAEHPLWRRKVVRNEATGRKRAPLGPRSSFAPIRCAWATASAFPWTPKHTAPLRASSAASERRRRSRRAARPRGATPSRSTR